MKVSILNPTSASSTPLGVFYSLLCAATYGLNPVLGKLGYMADLSGPQILYARFAFALVLFAALGRFVEKDFFKFSKKALVNSFIIAAAVLVPMNLLYVYSLKDIPASLMSLITYIYPFVVLVLNFVIFRRRITPRQIASVAFIITGCICIFSDALSLNVEASVLGIAFLAMFFYGVYLLSLQQFAEGLSAFQLSFLTILYSVVILSFIQNPMELLNFNAEQLSVTFLYGFISTVLSTFFLCRAIQCIGATESGIFCSFEPIFTISFSALLLGESIPLIRFAGMSILVLGIVLPNWKTLRNIFKSEQH